MTEQKTLTAGQIESRNRMTSVAGGVILAGGLAVVLFVTRFILTFTATIAGFLDMIVTNPVGFIATVGVLGYGLYRYPNIQTRLWGYAKTMLRYGVAKIKNI